LKANFTAKPIIVPTTAVSQNLNSNPAALEKISLKTNEDKKTTLNINPPTLAHEGQINPAQYSDSNKLAIHPSHATHLTRTI